MFIPHFKMPFKVCLDILASKRSLWQTLTCTMYLLGRENCLGEPGGAGRRDRPAHRSLMLRWLVSQARPPPSPAAHGGRVLIQMQVLVYIGCAQEPSHRPSETHGQGQAEICKCSKSGLFFLPENQLLNIYQLATVYKQDPRRTS